MKSEFLGNCQIETPGYIVAGMWRTALALRPHFHNVLDLGAGDGRFSNSTAYDAYLGLEVDEKRLPKTPFTRNARVINEDAFSSQSCEFDLCIGNPPYIRANRLDAEWREAVALIMDGFAGSRFNRNANLFIYFLMLALLRTKADGLVVQLIPFEWVSRPSALTLREYIHKNKWHVDVYRFDEDVFDRVLTTASITVIDKSNTDAVWRYYQLTKNFVATEILQPSGSKRKVLAYSKRHESAHALRGLSPGGQDIFTLTEHERLLYGLEVGRDVVCCITSLRPLPSNVTSLTQKNFDKYYKSAGYRCWLIRSDQADISSSLHAYLEFIGDRWRQYSTCTDRKNWWQYRIHPAAPLLVASGFIRFGPKVVKNSIKAVAIGSVYSVFAQGTGHVRLLESKLRETNFEAQVVSHSNNLKKIEIRQLNSVISSIIES